ncbi:MAG: type II secretion system protein [Opitutaceae bacterium]|nr:type II secretion system protein [Opitutaceae bacterium]
MKRRGFTLVELLIALALVGFLLVAMNTFLFSMGELWGRQSEQRLFELHVRNVTRFLQRELNRAGLPPNKVDTNLGIREVRTRNGTEDLLTFVLPDGSRLCEWPDGRALPEVFCGFVVRDRQGLFFVWQSTLEERFNQDPPRETLVTPWVTQIQYDYYEKDFRSWRTERAPRKQQGESPALPGRVRLTFSYDGMTREVVLVVPSVVEGLPQL